MQYINGMLNRNLVYELGNRFGWIPNHPMGLDALSKAQKEYAVQMNRTYVCTLKGIMSISEFKRIWALDRGKGILDLPNIYSPLVEEIESKVWKIKNAEGNVCTLVVRLCPYKKIVSLVLLRATSQFKSGYANFGIQRVYNLDQLDAVISLLISYSVGE